MASEPETPPVTHGPNTSPSAARPASPYVYPLPMPEPPAAHQRLVNFPLADTLFDPPLFRPTEQWPNLSRAGMRHVKNAFQVLYATLEDMGHLVNRCAPQRAEILFDWSEKHDTARHGGTRLVIEHGWLPRSSYQISAHGTNARSHVATQFRLAPLPDGEARFVKHEVAIMRRIFEAELSAGRTDALRQRVGGPFIFFPLQLATDFNLRYSNSPLAPYYSTDPEANLTLAQACVALMEQSDPPLPVVYKQHPADRTRLGGQLRITDRRSVVLTNEDAFTSREVLGSGWCRLVTSINSNTLHEALVFSLPIIALGSLLWQEAADSRPFAKHLQTAADLIGHDPLSDMGTLCYLHQLFANQWYLSDFQNPLMVQALIDSGAACIPLTLRRQFGFGTAAD